MDKFELQKLRELPIEGVAERLGQVLPGLVHHQLPSSYKDYSGYYMLTRHNKRTVPL